MLTMRRVVLKALLAVAAAPSCVPLRLTRESHVARLSAAVTRQQIAPAEYPETEVWSFNGRAPGPELRFRQGERARIVVENRLPQETTVHWHGLRVPNAMDGVPHVTQAPIAAGERFIYEFDLPDAGTYWYHPHSRSQEQVARGLYGAFIVEEREPIRVDRDLTWVLSDWRLTPEAQPREDFGSGFDVTHAGRIGNTVTVNGRFDDAGSGFAVVAGERLRLRLINTAVARIFALRFDRHEPQIIALDGQAVAPHAPPDGVIVLGPGMRADLVLDCMLAPGARASVSDAFYRGSSRRLIDMRYSNAVPLRTQAPVWNVALPPNAVPEPDLARATRHSVVLQGGAMGRLREAEYEGTRQPLAQLFRAHQVAWAINGIAVKQHVHAPLVTLKRGTSCVLAVENDTQWHHPLHLHGHLFRVITRNGAPTLRREWRDTVLMAPREKAELAFVADNPGDWMLHCHVLAHQAGGMMTMLRVA
jgi:FtsP/CotA-like multicopper oxidase with cupredoxin domain